MEGERGARYECALYAVFDFTEKCWCHLNSFQGQCYITASVPRLVVRGALRAPAGGSVVKQRQRLQLMLERAILALTRDKRVLATVRLMNITDIRLRQIVHYQCLQQSSQCHDLAHMFFESLIQQVILVAAATSPTANKGAELLESSILCGLDKTACKHGGNSVTVGIKMARRKDAVRRELTTLKTHARRDVQL